MKVSWWFKNCFRSTEYYVWEWEDENGKWNAYNAKTSLDLAVAEADGEDTVSAVACHRAYTIHLDKGEQVNDTTGVKRKVRCSKSGKS